MAAMTKAHCRECMKQTWQNPLKRAKATDELRYRCVECGFPKRTGMAKNTIKYRGKIMSFGANQTP